MTNYKNLINGFKQFRKSSFKKNRASFEKLATKQNPKTLFIACSDSRVDPSILTNSKLGEIFLIRNVANIIPSAESKREKNATIAAVEFAIKVIKVKNIIVMGHSGCAGVKAIIDSKNSKDIPYVNSWVKTNNQIIKSIKSKKINEKEKVKIAEKENIKLSLNNLKTFSWIKDKIIKKQLCIYGWYFSIESCTIEEYHEKKNQFTAI